MRSAQPQFISLPTHQLWSNSVSGARLPLNWSTRSSAATAAAVAVPAAVAAAVSTGFYDKLTGANSELLLNFA